MLFRCVLSAMILTLAPLRLGGQARSMAQDSALDNLRHQPGVETAALETLGRVRRVGEGPDTMLLIPGIGFGDGIWTEFMESHHNYYTMYAVTLPGFGGTPPLPVPADGSRFDERPWIRSSLRAIEALLDRERIERVTIVAHWALATQIALRIALDHPEQVEAVVLIGGSLKSDLESMVGATTLTAEQRANVVEQMGQRWFKTVTRQTWDDNNFMPYDYAVNPRRGLFLWREAQAPTLPVWIRYLLEFHSVDLSAELERLQVPTLVVHPDFDDPAFYVEEGRNYMRSFSSDSWRGAAASSGQLEFVTIPRSRLFIMYDQPEALDEAIATFLRRHSGRP